MGEKYVNGRKRIMQSLVATTSAHERKPCVRTHYVRTNICLTPQVLPTYCIFYAQIVIIYRHFGLKFMVGTSSKIHQTIKVFQTFPIDYEW